MLNVSKGQNMQKSDKTNLSIHNLLILAWIASFIIAAVWLLRPEQEIITPLGWKKWSQTGAIYALIPYKDGVLSGGSKGLWHSDGNSTVEFETSALPKGGIVTTLTQAENRGIWVGHSEGLSVFYKEKWQHWSTSNGLPKPPIRSIVLDNKGGWIAGIDGLIRFSGDFPSLDINKTRIFPNNNFSVQKISILLLDKSDNLWVGTSEAPKGGIFLLTGNKITFWGTDDGLPHPQVTSIMEDSLGQIWVGTGFHNRGGAAIFEQTKQGWRLKGTLLESELAGPKVRSLRQDKQGYYWIGSENNGIAIRDKKKIIAILRKEQGLPGKEVTNTLQTADGSIWLATLKGLVRIDTDGISEIVLPVKKAK